MNAKKARKLAAEKLPTLQELEALRREVQNLRDADRVVKAVVFHFGGTVKLGKSDLVNCPRGIRTSRRIEHGAEVFILQTFDPAAERAADGAAALKAHEAAQAEGTAQVPAADLPREGETENAWRARTGHHDGRARIRADGTPFVEVDPAAEPITIEAPQHPCQGCRWLRLGFPGGMTCRHGSRLSYECDPNCDLKELPAVAPVAIPDHRRPNNDQRSDCPECGAEWEQGKGCVNIDCPNCLPPVPQDQIAMTPKTTETEGA